MQEDGDFYSLCMQFTTPVVFSVREQDATLTIEVSRMSAVADDRYYLIAEEGALDKDAVPA